MEPRGCLKRVVVVQRDHVEDDVLGDRVRRADKGLAAASAFQAVEPDDRDTRLGLHRGNDPGHHGSLQAQGGGRSHAELEEITAIDAVLAQNVVGRKERVGLVHRRPPGFQREKRPTDGALWS